MMTFLDSIQAFDECLDQSNCQPVFVFKHSTSCPISAQAYQTVLRYASAHIGECPPIYTVKVIEYRQVSDAITDKLAIIHKSPQLILVQRCSAVWSASHYGISHDRITEALNSLQERMSR